MHDERYRTVFAFPRMVEDLLRGFAAREWAGALDFSTLRKMPAVLPVVLYTGEARWTAPREVGELVQPVPAVLAAYRPTQRHVVLDARHVGVEDLPESNLVTAVVRLEQTRTPWDLVEVARRLRRPDDDGLRRVLGRWVREVAESFAPPGEAFGAELTLEEVEMTVVERAREWSRQLIREGREQGIEQGREQGREQGLAHERALLRRMAALRFGAATAERLEEVLAGVADPGRLAEVGEWLVRCETGDEFLARATAARTESGPSKH